MADWRKSDTKDPIEVLMEREAKTCAGCKYRSSLWGMWICLKRDIAALRKCVHFKETE